MNVFNTQAIQVILIKKSPRILAKYTMLKMETKPKINKNLKSESLKDQFIESLKSTKLVLDPEINNMTMTYEQRKGRINNLECGRIKGGLKIMLERNYKGNVGLHFETLDEQTRKYKATLDVLAETKEQEQELAYDALTKISQFIEAYKGILSKR